MKNIRIEKKNSNERIDKFLAKEIFLNGKMTRGEIIRQIKSGNVLVNGIKIKPSYILKEGDGVEVDIAKKNAEIMPNEDIKLKIIFQDKNIIAINKPAGLQVHPDFHEKNNTLVNGLIEKFPEIKTVGDEPSVRPGIVHRLDRDTSGVMIVARNQKTFLSLKQKFKDRDVTKKYLALVYGKLERKRGTIEKPIARAGNYKKQIIAGKKTKTKVRRAVTEYEVTSEFNGFSLAEVFPKTGRTHQIRVHLASIGHPIVGDDKYGLKNIIPDKRAKRQLLHAGQLSFELKGKKYDLTSPMPEDMFRFIDCLD